MTTKEDVRKWLNEGIKYDYKYVTVFCDSTDNNIHYPVFSKDMDEFRINMGIVKQKQRIMEIYDLTMDIEKQLDESRAHHPPCPY
jgi:hypothetical protein